VKAGAQIADVFRRGEWLCCAVGKVGILRFEHWDWRSSLGWRYNGLATMGSGIGVWDQLTIDIGIVYGFTYSTGVLGNHNQSR
jgi:hypothetical protein